MLLQLWQNEVTVNTHCNVVSKVPQFTVFLSDEYCSVEVILKIAV